MCLNRVRSSVSLAALGCVFISNIAVAENSTEPTPADPFDFDLTNYEQTADDKAFLFSGSIEFRHRTFTERGETLSNRVAANLNFRWNTGNWLAFTRANFEYDGSKRAFRDPDRFELREAYVRYAFEDSQVSIGKQRIAWSTADGVGTIDRLNAVDLRDPIVDARTPSRRPSWAVLVKHSFDIGTLEAVWLPLGKDRKIAEFNSPWEPQFLNALRQPDGDASGLLIVKDPTTDDFGLRFSRYGERIDWSAALFNGLGDGPEEIAFVDGVTLLSPAKSTSYNLSAALGVAQSTLRGELTFTPDAVINGSRQQQWQLVAGADRTFFTDLYVNLQLFLFSNEIDSDEFGSTFLVSHGLFNDTVEVGMSGQIARDDQTALNLYFDYQVNDSIAFSTRFISFSGQSDSALGEFRQNDFIEFSALWSF